MNFSSFELLVESASFYGNHSSGNFLTHLGDLDWSLSIETTSQKATLRNDSTSLGLFRVIETDLFLICKLI